MPMPPTEINRSLLPLSWLYGIGVNFRNKLFDWNILKERSYNIPIICVGNITVGGTGKTPHIEYLVKILSAKYKIAVLSRGYKRKSKGFFVVETTSNVEDAGDEPLQIKQKFPNTLVVVDKNRRNAIDKIMQREDRPDIILLDDGFQHRYVKPSLRILLIDSNRPVFEDKLLPAGRLREPLYGINRASIVIVTKCNSNMQPLDFRIFSNGLNLFPYQSLYFTAFEYGDLKMVFYQDGKTIPLDELRKKHVLLITGIAFAKPLVDKLELKTYNLYKLEYPDHHIFEKDDIETIQNRFNEILDDDKLIVTTEKDAVRLRSMNFIDEELKSKIYFLPIRVRFLKETEKESFNKKIYNNVRSNKTNNRIS